MQRLLDKEALSYRLYSSEKNNPVARAFELRGKFNKIDFYSYDVIILGFLPQLLLKPVLKELSKTKGSDKKEPIIIAEMFLSMYDTVMLDRHMFEDGKPISSYLRKLDKDAIDAADLILTDTKANADYLARLYDVKRDKFETLYLEADNSVYALPETDKEKDGKVHVLYFGTGLPLQGTDVVLEAFNAVSKENTNYEFVFIGGIKGIPNIEVKKAAENPGIKLIRWLPQKRLAEKIAAADLCIAGHFNVYIGKADRTIPGKAFIYEAMNKPMILGDTRANRELFNEDGRHFFVKRGKAKELAQCIEEVGKSICFS